jgi:hypothetical protein
MTAKTNRKQIKTSAKEEVKENSSLTEQRNYEPGKEEIRELAEIIYYQRLEKGDYGTAEEDWLKAEDYLRNKMN